MKFKAVFLSTIILSLFGIFFLLFVKDPLVYLLYGYSPGMIGEYTAEAFMADQRTSFARDLVVYIVVGITFSCFIFSCVAMYWRIFLFNYLTHTKFLITIYEV